MFALGLAEWEDWELIAKGCRISFFFFLNKFQLFYFYFIYFLMFIFKFLFILFLVALGLLCEGFLWLCRVGVTLRCSAWASLCSGFSCCGAWALDRRLSSCGAWA